MKLAAVYARRHEPQWLIDDMRRNLGWVDELIELDDRDRPADQTWGHEGTMRARQRQMAVDAGADWVLVVDPDERLEDRAARVVRALMQQYRGRPVVLRLRLRELFAPDAYRVDGRWDRYWRGRLYPVRDDSVMSGKAIHCPPCPINHPRVPVDVNLYHLKMVEPANRAARALAYAGAEAQHGHPGRDWSRLTAGRGMVLRKIPPGRQFSPGYSRPYVIGDPQ